MDSYKRPAEPVKGSGSWWCLPLNRCRCRYTGIEKMVTEGLLDVLAGMPEDGLGVIHNRVAFFWLLVFVSFSRRGAAAADKLPSLWYSL